MLFRSVESSRPAEVRPLNPSRNPAEVQSMPSDLSALDLASIDVGQGVRLSDEAMELVSAIQESRQSAIQPPPSLWPTRVAP